MGAILPRRFEPIRVLRKGGASSTFVATDQHLGRNEVVVRVIGKGNFTPHTARLIEVFSWYRGVHHPFLSEVLDAGLTEKRDLYYVRPYHQDSDLFSAAGRNSLKALISAIDFLQSVGRVHGAIKPANIFAAGGAIKIGDPWIDESPDSKDPKRLEEGIRFSAPEILEGGAPTLDSDLYSLGALLYRFFSGRDPFEASEPEFLRAKYIWASPRPLSSVSHASRKIAEIVTDLLGKDPGVRRTAFESLKNELEVDAMPASRGPAIGVVGDVEAALKHLNSKRFGAVLVHAMAGGGKSRFIEELTCRLRFGKQAMAVCAASASESSLSLARRLVSLADEHSVKAGSTSLSRVQQFVGMAKEPTSRAAQEQINDDLVSLVAAVSRRIRLLLVIEDIDRTSRRLSSLVDGLVRQAEDSNLWIAITVRTGDAFTGIAASLRLTLGDTLREVSLSPLAAAGSRVLSSFLALDSDHRDRAEQRAGGNPWFLEEFCRSSSPAALPKPVRQTLSSVIATLPADARQAAEILSLFDEPATLDVIVEISGVPQAELKKTILDLERIGLVDGETLTIRYPDARVLIHSKIPKARRTDLHARCFRSLQAAGYKDSVLADHAFQGEMLEIAADLYRELGKACFARGDYLKAGRYFDLISLCCARDRTARPLDCEDSIKLARCCGAQGNNSRAKEILRRLLNAKSWGDSEVLSSIYSTMASVAIAGSPEERVRLLKLAIAALSRDSINLAHRHAALAGALISLGNLSEAQEVLKGIESYGLSETDVKPLVGIWGSLLLNQGNFRDAARCYSDALAISTSPGAIQTNLAVCLEQLGDIRGARERQTEALDHARQGGPLIFQVLCLGNLGAMETKLGNIRAAENRFHEARMTLRLASRQSANSEAIKVLSTTADMAELAIQKGEYRNARAFLEALDFRRSKTFSAFSAMDRFLVAMTRCQLHLALGQSQIVESLLKEARSLPVSGVYFQVERLLIEQCLEESSKELCGRLHQALAMCEQLGTVYQGCRVRIALGRHLVALGDHETATELAERSLKISTENGYGPVAAQSMLLVGLCAKRSHDRELALTDSMELSAKMGLAPMIADCAFHLGRSRIHAGDFHGAHVYLSKCLSIVWRLADELTDSDRKTYMSKSHNRESRLLFDEASRNSAIVSTDETDWFAQEGNLFAKLYRLAAVMAAGTDLTSAITALLQVLKETLPQSVVVMTGSGPKVVCHSIRGAVSDDIKKRVLDIASIAGNKPYIAGHRTNRNLATVVWMPISSLAMKGGIYVENAADCLLSERDIEFLTIAAAISASAFDHVCGRAVFVEASSTVDRHGIVGSSQQTRELWGRIEVAAKNVATVLIEGESGTGKELVARAIHQQSARSKGPFVPVDCGALPDGLIEAELFGAKKGAYTGAVSDHMGLFEAANLGTIFLDEISNLGIAAQAKLLRVLQDREIRKIGSTIGKTVDVRLIAATNCNLEKLVRDGKFRQDLLYRLKVLHILLPPLRDRKEDIPVLAAKFLERLNASSQSDKYFGPRVIEKFIHHNYPGNVRELQNAVERAFYTASSSMINEVEFFRGSISIDTPGDNETETWFKDLTEGRENFWSGVHERYKRRDISRERVIALVDFGLRTTNGSYKTMASMFQIPKDEYHRFMDFLRRSQCLLDFRPYRKGLETSKRDYPG